MSATSTCHDGYHYDTCPRRTGEECPADPGTPIEIVRTPASQYSAEQVEVRVHWKGGNSPSRVTIYGPETKSWGDERERAAQVNWSAIGSSSPEEATLYATAILLAAQLAPTLRPPTGVEAQA